MAGHVSTYPYGVCTQRRPSFLSLLLQLRVGDLAPALVEQPDLGQPLVIDRGRRAGAALAARYLELAQGQLLTGIRDQLEPVAAGRDAVVDQRQHPRGAALVAVDVADLAPARELQRRGVEVLAVRDRERVAVGVGELAFVGERDPYGARGQGRGARRRRHGHRQAAAEPGAARRRPHRLADPVLESRRWLVGRGEQEELVCQRGEPLEPGPAPRTVREVFECTGTILAVGDPERELGGELADPPAVGVHRIPPWRRSSSCPAALEPTFCIAARIRVFAVPSGISSIAPISRAV